MANPASHTGAPRAMLVALAFATAVIVTTEFVVVGLLPTLARDLDVSLADAGWFVTAFALSSAILGPPLTLAVSRWPARHVLTLALLAFGPGNLVAVIVPSHELIVVVRILQGAALPVFISISHATVVRWATPETRGQALAVVSLGVSVGLVLAVPAAVAVSDRWGWSLCFAGLATLAAVGTPAILASVPRFGTGGVAPTLQLRFVRRPVFSAHLLLSATLFAALFAGYTYLAAFLETMAGFDTLRIAAAMTAFGGAGLLGNWCVGHVVDRGPTRATAVVAAILVPTTITVSFASPEPGLLVPLLLVWGATHTAAFVVCQVRVVLSAMDAPAFAASLNISACNLGIAAGAAGGGWVVAHYGIEAIGLGSAAIGTVALVIALAILATCGESTGREDTATDGRVARSRSTLGIPSVSRLASAAADGVHRTRD